MTNAQLTKIEKQIAAKVKVPAQTGKSGKFTVDVDKLKKLAARINEYENAPHVPAQQ